MNLLAIGIGGAAVVVGAVALLLILHRWHPDICPACNKVVKDSPSSGWIYDPVLERYWHATCYRDA